jgi:hypothetical protein
MGLERENIAVTPEERRLVAYHEGGHAVVAAVLPIRLAARDARPRAVRFRIQLQGLLIRNTSLLGSPGLLKHRSQFGPSSRVLRN